jgi:hypothetical protein
MGLFNFHAHINSSRSLPACYHYQKRRIEALVQQLHYRFGRTSATIQMKVLYEIFLNYFCIFSFLGAVNSSSSNSSLCLSIHLSTSWMASERSLEGQTTDPQQMFCIVYCPLDAACIAALSEVRCSISFCDC